MEGKSEGCRRMTGAAINDKGSWDEVGVWLDWDRGRSLSLVCGVDAG